MFGEHQMRLLSCLALAFTLCATLVAPPAATAADGGDPVLQHLLAGPQRTAAERARDGSRHPYEMLRFFGLTDRMSVVEIWPGSGYWTAILAPYLHDHGTYYAALNERGSASAAVENARASLLARLAADPARYGRVITRTFGGDRHDIAPPGSADMVLTFRNLHTWMARGEADAAFQTFYRALKPGGILGIEEHRGRTDRPQDPQAASGYVREDYAIALAEKAGFHLAGRSEIGANPKDTNDYPAGVWTLPPTQRLGATDRAKYEAIGESDRFVLKFVKPAATKPAH
jgi:predicted methyltransferase